MAVGHVTQMGPRRASRAPQQYRCARCTLMTQARPNVARMELASTGHSSWESWSLRRSAAHGWSEHRAPALRHARSRAGAARGFAVCVVQTELGGVDGSCNCRRGDRMWGRPWWPAASRASFPGASFPRRCTQPLWSWPWPGVAGAAQVSASHCRQPQVAAGYRRSLLATAGRCQSLPVQSRRAQRLREGLMYH